MKTTDVVTPVSPEEVERRLAEYRRMGYARKAPAQVVYHEPFIACPWPGCGLRINGIRFQLEKWKELEDQLLDSWWRGPGLIGRCPRCGQYVLFALTSKAAVTDPSSFHCVLLPDDWKENPIL
jgi:hypothetical protein